MFKSARSVIAPAALLAAYLEESKAMLVRSQGRAEASLRRNAIEEAREEFKSDADRVMLDFVAATRRGICADTGFVADSDEE